MSYIPPIMADLFYEPSKFEKEIIDGQEHYIYKQIMTASNIKVDEERLKKALAFDREQFYEGYHQGYEARDNEIVRCKDCKHRRKLADNWFYCEMIYADTSGFHKRVYDDFFCGDGKRESE